MFKKLFLICCLAATLYACGGGSAVSSAVSNSGSGFSLTDNLASVPGQ
mgnify:CR=1 FL=1